MNTIETERLILRPITENDAKALYEYCWNEHVGPVAEKRYDGVVLDNECYYITETAYAQ